MVSSLRSKRRRDFNVQLATKFYVIRRGFYSNIYFMWNECEDVLRAFNGSKFKAFSTKEEAKEFLCYYIVIGALGERGKRIFYYKRA